MHSLTAALLINQSLQAVRTSFFSICAISASSQADVERHVPEDGQAHLSSQQQGVGADIVPPAHTRSNKRGVAREPPAADIAVPSKRRKRKGVRESSAGESAATAAATAAEAGGGTVAAGGGEGGAAASAPADSSPWWEPNPLECIGGETPTQDDAAGDRRFWGAEEMMHLVHLVEDPGYRRRHLGLEAVDFRVLAEHFRRSVSSVRSKYNYWSKVERQALPGARVREAPVRRAISYGWMAVYGLGSLPGMEGTGEQVLRAIESHPPFQALLDCSVRPDSAGVARWKQRVREELSHRDCFINTGRKVDGEAVWRLNLSDAERLPSKRPPKDMLPFLGRHGKSNG